MMRVAPVSADLLVKIGLGIVAIGAAWYVLHQASAAGSGIATAVSNAVDKVNPTNPENVAYQTANAMGGEIVGPEPDAPGRNADGSWSLGAWIYDVTH